MSWMNNRFYPSELDRIRRCFRNPEQDLRILCKILIDKLSSIYEEQGDPYIILESVEFSKYHPGEVIFAISNSKGEKIKCGYERTSNRGRRWCVIGKDYIEADAKEDVMERLGVTADYLSGLEQGIRISKERIEDERKLRDKTQSLFFRWCSTKAHSLSKAIKQLPYLAQQKLGDSLKVFNKNNGCVYFLINEKGCVLYVGSSQHLATRIAAHRKDKDFVRVLFWEVPLRQMLDVEHWWIYKLRPPLNKHYLG